MLETHGIMLYMKTNVSIADFGSRLKELRKTKGLTQVSLSQLSGISRRAIAHYETQVIKPPVDKLNTLADVLGVSVDELLGKAKSKKTKVVPFKIMKYSRVIEQLPPKDQNEIFQHVKSLARKNKLEGKI
jgi:transcriptional regulator with XRE-family HTH domain